MPPSVIEVIDGMIRGADFLVVCVLPLAQECPNPRVKKKKITPHNAKQNISEKNVATTRQ
jgi:hypothetical protein